VSICYEDRSDAVDQSEYQDEEHDQQSASVADVELKNTHYQSLQHEDSIENGNLCEVTMA